MTERNSDPPRNTPKPRTSGSGRNPQRLLPEECEIKVRWEKARRVLEVSPTGVKFQFDNALKVGLMYPVTLTAPGVSLATTLEVTRCQLTVTVADVRFFLVEGKFFPYVE